jgi:hypothetical protein
MRVADGLVWISAIGRGLGKQLATRLAELIPTTSIRVNAGGVRVGGGEIVHLRDVIPTVSGQGFTLFATAEKGH